MAKRDDASAGARKDDASAGAKKTPTKKGELIRLLKAKAGADVAVLGERLGWQPHTVRAAITGLRKAGHVVVATRPASGGALCYRIVPGAGKAKVEKPPPNTLEKHESIAAAEPAETPDDR